MANRMQISDVDARLDHWHKRLTRAVNEINKLRDMRKRMVRGKLKVPPPPGVKVKIGDRLHERIAAGLILSDDINDIG